jgi:hypothetical protein
MQNRCPQAIGVQVRITGLDKSGNAVAVQDLWPASTNNINPGAFTFSVDQYLDYNPEIARFVITPIAVNTWR